MKYVPPAVTGEGYAEMKVSDGQGPSREFLRITNDPVPAAEAERVREQLDAYCGLDTKGMVWIVEELEKSKSLTVNAKKIKEKNTKERQDG